MEKRDVIVYREPGRYAGWPANYGIWSWGDEIVVGFTAGYPKEDAGFHARDKDRPFITMQARSLDGGSSWQAHRMPIRTPGNRGVSADEHMRPDLGAAYAIQHGMENAPVDCPGGINLAHPDLALLCARTGLGAGTLAFFYVSTDRCHTWEGPYRLPDLGQTGIEARTDYLVSDARTCTFLLTASWASGREGRGVFCARTSDGGQSFRLLSWVARSDEGFVIMPSSVRLTPSRILTAVRCRGRGGDVVAARNWIDLYLSEDDGLSWRYLGRPVEETGPGGNPPSMIRLRDGRLCLTYGYRAAPYGIRAKLSADEGRAWGDEIILRDDGGSHDLGYPRTVQRTDGTIVTVYYFNDRPGGAAYIAATLWRP